MSSVDRRNLIRALVQHRIGPSPRTRKRKWRRVDRHVRLANGMCRDCNSAAMPGISRCSACRARHSTTDKARYEEQSADGCCRHCQAAAAPNRTLCAMCGERSRIYAKAHRDERVSNPGICRGCLKPRDSEQWMNCSACRERAARYKRDARRRAKEVL